LKNEERGGVKMKTLFQTMIEVNADGIDFFPVMSGKLICGYTLEEFRNVRVYPKSNWKMYRVVDGYKVYFDVEEIKEG
jgi:hypothetical protein